VGLQRVDRILAGKSVCSLISSIRYLALAIEGLSSAAGARGQAIFRFILLGCFFSVGNETFHLSPALVHKQIINLFCS
jgi:hypothetical protein